MYEAVIKQMDKLKAVAEASGKKFMYAENQMYTTPIQKAAERIRAKKSKIMFMNSENLLIGSMKVIYSACCSAEEGRRIFLDK